MHASPNEFSQRLLVWFIEHGRKHLPWQQEITPYRVWISEIMLQQTQVATVIPYFERFINHFPNVQRLANAKIEEVLALWTGLGYYSRARNLHKAALLITQQYKGQFPSTPAALISLPGIGRSTAGAILSIAFEQPAAILDGNVKRVLARHFGIEGFPGETTVANALWTWAEKLLPSKQARAYTQALMDLGATLCTAKNPECPRCPLVRRCVAYRTERVGMLPSSKPKQAAKPVQILHWLVLVNKNKVYLEQKPDQGIWAKLWCFPQFNSEEELRQYLGAAQPIQSLPHFKHELTHKRLYIYPHVVTKIGQKGRLHKKSGFWYDLGAPMPGVPKPVQSILEELQCEPSFAVS